MVSVQINAVGDISQPSALRGIQVDVDWKNAPVAYNLDNENQIEKNNDVC